MAGKGKKESKAKPKPAKPLPYLAQLTLQQQQERSVSPGFILGKNEGINSPALDALRAMPEEKLANWCEKTYLPLQ